MLRLGSVSADDIFSRLYRLTVNQGNVQLSPSMCTVLLVVWARTPTFAISEVSSSHPNLPIEYMGRFELDMRDYHFRRRIATEMTAPINVLALSQISSTCLHHGQTTNHSVIATLVLPGAALDARNISTASVACALACSRSYPSPQ